MHAAGERASTCVLGSEASPLCHVPTVQPTDMDSEPASFLVSGNSHPTTQGGALGVNQIERLAVPGTPEGSAEGVLPARLACPL